VVRPIRFELGRVELALTDDAPGNLLGELAQKLEQWTGTRWMVSLGHDQSAPTIAEARTAARAQLVENARTDPLVAAVFARFPGAEIVDVRVKAVEADAASAPPPAPFDEMRDEDN
jgi:DNA polymerase-3 subunit gamma/tau